MWKVLIFLTVIAPFVYGQLTNDAKNINATECGRRLSNGTRIVGGVKSTTGDWGWQAALFFNGRFTCGGSLINSQWVVTAAHCIRTLRASNYTVRLGYTNLRKLETWSITKSISKVLVHRSYDDNTVKNDIALLKFTTPIKYNKYVLPVCIPAATYNIPTGKEVYATGWGLTNETAQQISYDLMQVNFTVISEADCIKANDNTVSYKDQICAGKKGGNKDTCQGDSGGPLVTQDTSNKRWYLGGITSWGYGCSGAGVYTRTSAFVSWIRSVITYY